MSLAFAQIPDHVGAPAGVPRTAALRDLLAGAGSFWSPMLSLANQAAQHYSEVQYGSRNSRFSNLPS